MIIPHFNLRALVRLGTFFLLALGLGLAAAPSHAAGPPPPANGAPAAPPLPGGAKAVPPQLPALTPGCSLQWHFTNPPVPAVIETDLEAVAALSPTNIWAVGYTYNTDYSESTLIEHWDGANWSIMPSPNVPGAHSNGLYGVSAISATDIWAVGSYSPAPNTMRPLSLHWDGLAWSLVAVADPGVYSYFTSVTALSPNEVWAAGEVNQHTLIMHEANGHWYADTTPNLGAGHNMLNDIVARTPSDIWAVGWATTTLALHWAGSVWVVVDTSPLNNGNSGLNAVLPLGTSDVWAVGYRGNQALIGHWNGASWSPIAAPQPGTLYNALADISETGSGDLWAVGNGSSTNNYYETLALHWNGGAWTSVPTLNQGPNSNALRAVAALAPDNVFAFGYYYDADDNDQPLVEQYTENQQFSDVPSTSPYYPYIHCLACRGILGGYTSSPPCAAGAAPCFLPGANITRGQIAKILANAAGLSDSIPSTQQTFEDMPNSNPFWVYAERLALPGRGYVSGYACGQAPAGPCVGPANRPYFMPGNNVTRGQLAKMAANAKGLSNAIPSSQQTFEDVPNTSAFWIYVERLAPLSVISGYQCGQAPAGACVAPGNRSYFLPGNPVTRGQTAKIVGNTFFPNCQP